MLRQISFNLKHNAILVRKQLRLFASNTQDPSLSKEKKDEKSFYTEDMNPKEDIFKASFYSKRQKMKKRELLKKEISTNPEFFNAFPHLKEKAFPEKEKEEESFQEQVYQKLESKKVDYFDSLKKKYYNYHLKTNEERETENETNFVEAYSRREGPMKYMSREEKDKIHNLIDDKIRELEATGLSREEILLNKPIGIPLKNDKFFQYIKNNRIAREMLIKPSEAFNVDTVIEKALKQDIGPDPTLAVKDRVLNYKNDLPDNYDVKAKHKLMNRPFNNKLLSSDLYDYNSNYLERTKTELNFEKSRPVSFQNPPLSRAQFRKKYMIRNIKKRDIHWKNIPLLTKFVNEIGQIMNRYQTRLPTPVQKKVAKTIKHVRNLGLLPFCDYIKPQDKLPLTSILTNFYDSSIKVVDQNTGRINIIQNPSDKEQFVYSSFSVNEAKENLVNQKKFEQIKNSIYIDTEEIPIVASDNQRDWMIAQNFLLKKDKIEITDLVNRDKIKEEEKVFQKVASKVINNLHINNLTESYIYEKSYNVDSIDKTQKYFSIVEKKPSYINEINKLNDEIKQILKETDILNSSIDYQKEYSRIKSGNDPELNIDEFSSKIGIEMKVSKKKEKKSKREFRKRNAFEVESVESDKINKI